MWGRQGTYAEYGAGWATVSMTPFRLYKGFLSEGGIRAPLFVRWPGRLSPATEVAPIAAHIDPGGDLSQWFSCVAFGMLAGLISG